MPVTCCPITYFYLCLIKKKSGLQILIGNQILRIRVCIILLWFLVSSLLEKITFCFKDT